MVRNTAFHAELQPQCVAFVKLQSQKFTWIELHISESSFVNIGKTQVAVNKFAIDKCSFRNIGTVEIALFKCTIFIAAFFYAFAAEIFPGEIFIADIHYFFFVLGFFFKSTKYLWDDLKMESREMVKWEPK